MRALPPPPGGLEALPASWQRVELNPAWVTAQRKVNGCARRKTDPVDLIAIADLLLAGRGYEIVLGAASLVELAAWVAHRRRRVAVRSALKNQLTGQVDRAFPGLGACLSSVAETKVGRLVVAEFADPARLARLGAARFRAFAANRDVRVSVSVAERLVAAARDALPTPEAPVARQVLAADLALLGDLDAQIAHADERIAALVPATPFQVLTSGPGWGPARVGAYAAALGDPARWPSHRQVYRAAGLNPAQYESAGRRRDGAISREGSVHLRRALIDLEPACGTKTAPPAPTPPVCVSAASPARSSPARSRGGRTRSPSRWCATSACTTPIAGQPRSSNRALHNSGSLVRG